MNILHDPNFTGQVLCTFQPKSIEQCDHNVSAPASCNCASEKIYRCYTEEREAAAAHLCCLRKCTRNVYAVESHRSRIAVVVINLVAIKTTVLMIMYNFARLRFLNLRCVVKQVIAIYIY